MSKTKRIVVRFDDVTVEQIKAAAGDKDMSEYIREAVDFRLLSKINLESYLISLNDKIEGFEIENLKQRISDVELKTHIILEGMKKQNEILKVIFRRTTVGANLVKEVLDDMKESDQFSLQKQSDLRPAIDDFIKKLGI